MEQAIKNVINELKGTWALAIICKDEPNKMYCVKYGSSLLIGLNDSYIMVSSELAGFENNIRQYICLNDNDIAILKKENNIVNFNNISNYNLKNIDVQSNELLLDFQHWTIKEIYEQYDASIRAITTYKYNIRPFGDTIIIDNLIPYIKHIIDIIIIITLGIINLNLE
jgi:glucosamine--fructose-6-phosphate aminotransferase (isomerizing)